MCAKVWSDDTLEIMEILDDTPGTHHHPSMQIHQLPKESHQTHAILPIHLTQQRRSIPPANPPYKGNTSISVTNSSASTPIPPSANHYPYPTTQTHQQRTPPPSNPPSDPPPPPLSVTKPAPQSPRHKSHLQRPYYHIQRPHIPFPPPDHIITIPNHQSRSQSSPQTQHPFPYTHSNLPTPPPLPPPLSLMSRTHPLLPSYPSAPPPLPHVRASA